MKLKSWHKTEKNGVLCIAQYTHRRLHVMRDQPSSKVKTDRMSIDSNVYSHLHSGIQTFHPGRIINMKIVHIPVGTTTKKGKKEKNLTREKT